MVSPPPGLIKLAAQYVLTWPSCIQPDAITGIIASGCPSDPSCFCEDKIFRLELLAGMTTNCTAVDIAATQSLTKELCPVLDESRKATIIAVMVVTTLLAFLLVTLRVVSRKVGHVKFWWDDYLIIFVMLVTLGESANIFSGVADGMGKHIVTLSASQMTGFLKNFWITQVLFAFSMTGLKMSILLFYRRIFTGRPMAIALTIAGCFNLAWFVAQFVSVMVSCRPLAYFWDKTIPHGKCIDENLAGYLITSVSLLMDLVIFLIPIPPLWGLKKSLAQRLSLIGLFLAGALVCIAGAVRIPFLVELDLTDVTWSIVPAGLWIQIEVKVGIVCACLPTLPPLFRRMRQHLLALSSGSNGERSPSSDGKNGGAVVVADAKNGDASPGRGSKRGKQHGWYSQMLNSFSNKGAEELTESREEIVEVHEGKCSDESV